MNISDKLKAVVAGVGTLAAALTAAVEDSTVTIQEGGVILLAAIGVGVAVYRVRNKPSVPA